MEDDDLNINKISSISSSGLSKATSASDVAVILDCDSPTPFYNSTILEDLYSVKVWNILHETLETWTELRQGVLLLKRWLKVKIPSGFAAKQLNLPLTLVAAYVCRSKSRSTSALQIFKLALSFIVDCLGMGKAKGAKRNLSSSRSVDKVTIHRFDSSQSDCFSATNPEASAHQMSNTHPLHLFVEELNVFYKCGDLLLAELGDEADATLRNLDLAQSTSTATHQIYDQIFGMVQRSEYHWDTAVVYALDNTSASTSEDYAPKWHCSTISSQEASQNGTSTGNNIGIVKTSSPRPSVSDPRFKFFGVAASADLKKFREDVLRDAADRFNEAVNVKSREIPFAFLIAEKIVAVLNEGLGDRLVRVWARFDTTNKVVIGLKLVQSNMEKTVVRGPSADLSSLEQQVQVATFRALWGKTEVRRFKDGTIQECVVWQQVAPSLYEKELPSIAGQMIDWLMEKHFSVASASSVKSKRANTGPSGVCNTALQSNEVQVWRDFNEFKTMLMGLEDLPLRIHSISPVSRGFSYNLFECGSDITTYSNPNAGGVSKSSDSDLLTGDAAAFSGILRQLENDEAMAKAVNKVATFGSKYGY